ncbi:hypothetical protein IQ265_18665 [Nodosilinea sp. LEGE 06152]|uniref:hypothetical protein n=1 Tax=Nodosilinea sp. LEGE 06152 TaxID=2777966 RepID=UPI0018815D9D|nr:hypothetical protein [Nodosilinea sp. LEGE 06152]MBE9158842.1 hypothetical protein [Nodosilinea sp. LEGE 06152]
MTDMTRRLAPKRIAQDIQALNSLNVIANYAPMRPEAARQALRQAYETMEQSQKDEVLMEATLKATRDRARQAEWAFHNAVLAMKQSVLGQFGPNSSEIQAIGYTKASKRKRSSRQKPPLVDGDNSR